MSTNLEAFDELVAQLRELFFALRGVTARMLVDLDCTAVERGVLYEIDRLGPQTVPAMARARAVSRQAMQKTIDRLVARRWLRAEPNPSHARSPLIALAPAGQKAYATIRAREAAALGAARLPVGAAELRRTTQTLAQLSTFFAQFEPTRSSR